MQLSSSQQPRDEEAGAVASSDRRVVSGAAQVHSPSAEEEAAADEQRRREGEAAEGPRVVLRSFYTGITEHAITGRSAGGGATERVSIPQGNQATVVDEPQRGADGETESVDMRSRLHAIQLLAGATPQVQGALRDAAEGRPHSGRASPSAPKRGSPHGASSGAGAGAVRLASPTVS